MDPTTDTEASQGLRCTQCTEVFEDVLALLSHLDSHSAQCTVCKKEFTSKEFLDHHMKSHDDGTLASTNENSAVDELNSKGDHVEGTASNGNIEETTSPDGDIETNKMSIDDKGTNLPPAETNGSGPQDEITEGMKDTNNVLEDSEKSPTNLPNGPEEESLPNGGDNSAVIDKIKEINEDSSSPAPDGSVKPKADKPYRCSKCKYAAKSVASVNMHQRKQHAGEWATVISTLDDTEVQTNKKADEPSEKDRDVDELEDKEVSLALRSPLPASDSDGNDEEEDEEDPNKPLEYRCSMCNFTAQDTDTVFQHQREKHPVEWEPSSDMLSPERKEAEMSAAGEGEMDDHIEPMYELPTELDHYSSMGRSIIAGSMADMQGMSNNNNQVNRNYPPPGYGVNTGNTINSAGYNSATGKYHCSNCPAYFYEVGQLRRHHQMCINTETLNSNLAQYRCCLCKRVFPDKNTLLPHMLNHQRNFPRYRCSVCAYRGKFEGTIIAHINHRHPGSSVAFVEKIAGQDDVDAVTTFWERIGPIDKEGDLEAEDVTDDPDLQQLFSGVSQSFSQRNDSQQGISPQEAGVDSGSGPVDMDSQSQTSELSDDSLVEPTQWSPETLNSLKFGNNYMCPECPVLFREAYKLKRHMESHGGVKRHICKICGKGFTRSEHLRRHRVVHANTKPYMCSLCGYSAKRLDNLQKHQRTKHLGETCEIIRVSKEMIEAEIAANENAKGAAAPEPLPPPMPKPQIVVTPQQPQPMMMPMKAKRGRPRKISSPQDNFMFCRDPNFVPSRHPSSFSTRNMSSVGNTMNSPGNLNMSNPLQNANGIHSDISMNLTSGGNLSYNAGLGNPLHINYNSPQPSTSFYPYPMFGPPDMSSTPIKMPGFDLSQITAAAAAAAMPQQNNIANQDGGDHKVKPEPIENIQAGSDMASSLDIKPNIPQSLSHISGLEKAAAALATMTNRGKYQCHVCDRPFSYLKPFKKHLLCHGTFMPYECSKCGHQSKRRDMIQDHQRDAHPGEVCEIHVNEPTSDMHDMMDTYIQQIPEQRPQGQDLPTRPVAAEGSPMQSGAVMKPPNTPGNPAGPPNAISEIDRSMVDPQLNFPLSMVKIEPIGSQSDKEAAASSPQPSAAKPAAAPPSPAQAQNKPKHELIIRTRRQLSKEAAADAASTAEQVPASPSTPQNQKQNTAQQPAADPVVKSERSTSSPVVFSQLMPSTETGLARPRARRANLIKFKVLSPHTKTVSKPPPVMPEAPHDGDDESREDSQGAISDLPYTDNENSTPSVEKMPEVKREEEDESFEESAVKRRRLDENSVEPEPASEIKEEKVDDLGADPGMLQSIAVNAPLIGKAPKVPIMGAKVGKPVHPATEALVVNIKSHKGSPKEKQGDNHKFVCSVCEQRFAYEKPFKRHLLVHGGFQPYKCNVCGHLTTSRDSMKVHQHKVHSNQKGLGITVLEPTPEMEQNLIRQGLLQQYVSEDEENPATKSIVETARMEQHKLAAAMKSLSATVKRQADNPEVKKEDGEQQSFPMALGLRPATSSNSKSDTKEEGGETSGTADNSNVEIYDELSDMPVDDAIFNLQGQTRMIIEPKGEGFKCQICGKSFQCSSKMQRHMISHTGIKAYECQICFKKLTRLEHLKRHLLTHGNIKPYRCSACKFDAKRLDIVQLHQQMTHAGEAVEIVYLFTPSVIETAGNAGAAVDDRPMEGHFACEPCGLSFTHVNDLMAHQKTHATAKPYVCFVCDKSFTRPEHLKRHRLVHDDTKPYRCSECGFKTKRLDGMREHQRSRHPESPVFIIDTVLPDNAAVKRQRGRPPKFGRRDSLDGLQLMHCDKCCLAFYDQNRFEQHKIMHIPSPTKPQDLTCPVCGLRLSLPKHLRRHMLLHESHVPYQCSLCGYSAKRTDHMKLHFRKQHPDGGAQIIYIAKDNYTGQTSSPMVLSDDSYNDGSSLGNDSFFDDYADGEIEEADLTLEQLTAMAHDQAANRQYSDEEEYMNNSAYGEGVNLGEESYIAGMTSEGLVAGEESKDIDDESNGQMMEGVEDTSACDDMAWSNTSDEPKESAQSTPADTGSNNACEQADNATVEDGTAND